MARLVPTKKHTSGVLNSKRWGEIWKIPLGISKSHPTVFMFKI